MSDLTIEVQARRETGKNKNRRLRAQGLVPAVVYGGGRDPVPIQLERKTLLDLMRSTEGHNPVFLLKLGDTGKSRHTMIRELQVDPVSRQVLHVDFLRVVMTENVRARVHVELVGVPEGVKTEGGMVDFVTREVEVECLPDRIPAKLELDVSALHAGEHLEASALEVPEGVTLLEEPSRVIASVAHARVEIEEEEEAEELLAAEEEEPEVIGRRGAEEEGEKGEEEGD